MIMKWELRLSKTYYLTTLSQNMGYRKQIMLLKIISGT